MRTFWIWLASLCIVWICAVLHASVDAGTMAITMMGGAVMFTAYFISPLLRRRPLLLAINLIVASIVTVIVLWPVNQAAFNPYTLLILSILAGHVVYMLPSTLAYIVGVVQVVGAFAPSFKGYPSLPPLYIGLYSLMLGAAFTVFRITLQRASDAEGRNEALLGEYRKMKRRVATGEEIARQEERMQIGRDIHDSVGHKLTALMMQLEVARMQAESDTDKELEHKLGRLKDLARDSLRETRNAVKSLNQSEASGLPAIMGLIRKLEADSLIKIHFTIRHGALTAPLTNEQSISVYRGVQEALTNIMKHSKSREAEVLFEAPGSSIFRFEITNPIIPGIQFREGFGLQTMRERLAQHGGNLEVLADHGQFIVRGTMPLNFN